MAISTSIADLNWLQEAGPTGIAAARGANMDAQMWEGQQRWQQLGINRQQLQLDRQRRAEEILIRQQEEARKAKEAAIQFAGFQDYQAAVDAGMAPDEAIKQHGAKMFYKSATFPNFLSAQERAQISAERAGDLARHQTEVLTQKENTARMLGEQFDRREKRLTDEFGVKEGRLTSEFTTKTEGLDKKLKAETDRANKAEEGRNTRAAAAIVAQRERDLFKKENYIDKNNRFISEAEFVNRHLKGFMDLGIKEGEALKRIRDVYKELPQTSTAPSRTQPLKGSVRVQAPDGRIGTIPKEQLPKAKAAGYTEAP